MDTSNRLVSVVIATSGRNPSLWDTLRSVDSQSWTSREIILVVNNPSGDFLGKVNTYFPSVEVIKTGEVSYAGSLNLGIEQTGGEFILCLNDDVILEKEFIKEAMRGFSLDEKIGIVSGKILRMDKKTIDSTGLYVDICRSCRDRGYGIIDDGRYDKPGYIFGASGSACFLRRRMLDSLKLDSGYFDSSYGFFYEDLDIAWRARNAGWQAYYIPRALAYHFRGKTLRKKPAKGFARRYLDDRYHFCLVRNRYLTVIKNERFTALFLHLPFILIYDLAVFGYILLFRPYFLFYLARQIEPFCRSLKRAYKTRKEIFSVRKRRGKINLLFVITKPELGGAQKHLLELVKRIDKNIFRVFLLTAKEGLLMEDFLAVEDITVKRSPYLERPVSVLKDLLALVEIYAYIKKNNIDIVHTHSSKAGVLGRIAARCAGTRAVLHTVHGWSFNDYQPFLVRMFYIILERICAFFSDKLIVVSLADRKKGLDNSIGVQSKYVLVRYGIDLKEWTRDCPEEGILHKGKYPQILNVSCFKSQKGLMDFLKAAALVCGKIPEAKFVLVGDGVLREKIEKGIKILGIQENVELMGWRRDVFQILHKCDIFILTSLWEGLPISALEAMACKKAVVVTDTGGVKELIREGHNGYIVPRQDYLEMSRKILSLLGDGNLRSLLGQHARDTLMEMKLDVREMVSVLEDVYISLYGN